MALDENLTYEMAAALSQSERADLLNRNPVMAARCFKHRVDCIITHILGGLSEPLGKIVGYWFRVEFQA